MGLPASEVQAQALRFDGGLVAGLNASQVQGDDYTGFNKLGLSGGAFVDVRNPDNYWGIRLGDALRREGQPARRRSLKWAPPPSSSA